MTTPATIDDDTDGYDAFISYSRLDGSAYASRLKEVLKAGGAICFFDREVFEPGDALDEATVRALRRSRHLVLVCTPGALGSPHVRTEVTTFAALRRPVIRTLLRRRIIRIRIGSQTPATDQAETGAAILRATDGAIWLDEPEIALQTGPAESTAAEIQRSFTGARQRAVARRRRLRRGALFVLLTLGLLLTAWAATTRGRRAAAADLLRRAEARLSAGDVGGAIDLAVQGWERLPSDDAHDILRRLLDRTPRLVAALPDRAVNAVAVSADAARVMTVSFAARRVRGWGGASGDSLWSLPLGARAATATFDDGARVLAVTYTDADEDAGAASRTVRVWDLTRGVELPPLQHAAPVGKVAFSADGHFLATASGDSVAVWAVGPDTQVTADGAGCAACAASAVALSANGRLLAWTFTRDTAGGAAPHRLRLIDRSRGGHEPVPIPATDSLPAPQHLWFDTGERRLVYDTGAELRDYDYTASGRWHASATGSVAAHGRLLATTPLGRDGSLTDLTSPRDVVLSMSGFRGVRMYVAQRTPGGYVEDPDSELWHEAEVLRVVVPRDSATILTVTRDGAAHVWVPDSLAFHELVRLGHPGGARGVAGARSGDGRYVATLGIDSTVRLWKVPDHGLRLYAAGVPEGMGSVAFSRNGHYVAAVSSNPDRLRLWDATTLQLLRTASVNWRGNAPAVTEVTDDGGRVVLWPTADASWVWETADSVVRRWGADTAIYLTTATCSGPAPARAVAAVRGDSTLRIWGRVRQDDATVRIGGLASPLACHPRASDVAAAVDSTRIRVWRIDSSATNGRWVPVPVPLGDDTAVVDAVEYSSRGAFLAAAWSSGRVQLWRGARYAPVSLPQWDKPKRVCALAFSPDETRLAIATYNGTVRVVATGGDLVDEFEFGGCAEHMAFTSDGAVLALSGMVRPDRVTHAEARLRNVREGDDIMTLPSLSAPGALAFGPGDSLLVVAWHGGLTPLPSAITAELWSTADLVREARRRRDALP